MLMLTRTVQDDAVLITLSGQLDESANLEPVELSPGKRFVIDVHDVTGLNSLGLRSWIDWMKSLSTQTNAIEFRGVRKSLAFQFNTVMGMFPEGATLHSIDLPMICDLCGREDVTFLTFPEPISQMPQAPPDLNSIRKTSCARTDCEYQSEYANSHYFRFLKRA